MTNIKIPLDEVGEALVTALWTALAGPLNLVSCHQSIFEPLAEQDEVSHVFPAIRVMEPSWQSQPPKGSNPVLPVVDGQMSYLVGYGRTFGLAESAWSRQLIRDAELIARTLWAGDMQIPGFTPPDGVVVKGIWIGQLAAAASPEDEDLGVRIAEAQIRVTIDVQLRAER